MEEKVTIELAPIIGASIAAIATLLGVSIANWFNSRQLQQNHDLSVARYQVETKTAKSEELYLSLFQWHKDLSSIYILHLRYFVGELDYEQVQTILNERFSNTVGTINKIEMLVNVHFPEYKSDLASVHSARKSLAKYLDARAPEKLSKHEFVVEQQSFDTACNEMLERIAQGVSQL
ncbi:hypothetical protein EJ063_19620 [Vibrio aquaticus]|uniref:DUF2489 domain-containing protein n=1 Tax=Vibrio aquaticus TaxID=2496559 RepID=A0A3S0MG29_9VIBR|nr:hypothetical protein [Vibrio aquaticus]EIO3939947.1 hypothetical protein [Vibrio vulnificus]EKZ9057748.1 hypothetical protein [Vibrio vulnificus]RTZ13556.1 hypothetical protein EJ063_19620 [Vibrio aquaticus]